MGVPATDGGFLQVMLATRGETEMGRLAVKGKVVSVDELPRELRELRVRYGELVVGDKGGYMGIGTEDEVVVVRRRKGWVWRRGTQG